MLTHVGARGQSDRGGAEPVRHGPTLAGGVVGCCLFLVVWGDCGRAGAAGPPHFRSLKDFGSEAQLAQASQPTQPMQPQPQPPRPGPGDEPLPPARPFLPPFGPGRIRLPRLPGAPGPLGTTPVPSPRELAIESKFVEGFVDQQFVLDLIVGQSRIMLLKEAPNQTQIADNRIASFTQLTPRQIILLGREVGTTVLTLWFRDPTAPQGERIISYRVRVLPDPEAKRRLEMVYKALQAEINEAFPDSHVQLFLVGDKLAVSGQAKDIAEATQILRIVRANAPENGPEDIPVQALSVTVPPYALSGQAGLPGLRDFLVAGGPNVINLLRVPGEQQVMLRVMVAEVNRAAARSIGLNFNISSDQGVTVFQNRTGNIATGGSGAIFSGFGAGSMLGQVTNNLPIALDSGQINLAVNALRTLNYARSLAEPNLVAMNGQQATFQAGGQFPVPVTSGGFGGANAGFGGLQGVQFVPFGVQLNFTPYISDKDRIRLTIAAEVSTRDLSASANIGGANVPGLNTRNFQTTVELREGQTLAVAGLIQTNLGATAERVPFLGDLPFLNNLTGLTQIQNGEQELVILITPELVHPLDAKEVPAIPGSDLFEPGDLEFYFLGRIESYRDYDYRSTVRTDIHKMKAYRRCEQLYIFGPTGHSEH